MLEERIALSQLGTVHVAAVHSKPAGTPVLKHQTLNDVNRSIDTAFNRFNKDYASELTALNRTGNSSQFQTKFNQSVTRLRSSLASQAARIPVGSSALNTDLQQRVDSLVNDLKTNKSITPSTLIKADQSGSHADVGTFVHNEASKGDLSLR